MSAAILNPQYRQDTIPDRAADYRRHARRLRHTYRGEPNKLHQSLRYLSACHDIATGRTRPAVRRIDVPTAPEYVIDQTSNTIRDFANAVVKSMTGPVLPYSQRLELMRHAKKIGLRTFDANLIIAAVQNRVKETMGLDVEQSEAEKPMSWRFAIAIGAILQVGIIVGIWWMFR